MSNTKNKGKGKALDAVREAATEVAKLESQIARSLETYRQRGEYDGSYDSALRCLKWAEYETRSVKLRQIVRKLTCQQLAF